MGKGLAWYKRNPADAINGMVGLTFEEQGFYNALLDNMYLEGGGLRDDPQFMGRLLRCNPRTYVKLRDRLIAAGKISCRNGLLVNARALAVMSEQAQWREGLAEAGAKGGKARAMREAEARSPDLFGGDSAPIQPPFEDSKHPNDSRMAPEPPTKPTKKANGINESGQARLNHARAKRESDTDEKESLSKTHILVTRADVDAGGKLWNECAEVCGWPVIVALNDHRRAQLKARMEEYGPDAWRDALNRASRSNYLAGEQPPHWFRFDWAVGPRNFPKLLEGNYDELRANDRDPTTAALARYIGAGD